MVEGAGIDPLWSEFAERKSNQTTGCATVIEKVNNLVDEWQKIKGRQLSINTVQGGSYFYDEPVTCVLGSKNPQYALNFTEFCELNIPDGIEVPQTSKSERIEPLNVTIDENPVSSEENEPLPTNEPEVNITKQ